MRSGLQREMLFPSLFLAMVFTRAQARAEGPLPRKDARTPPGQSPPEMKDNPCRSPAERGDSAPGDPGPTVSVGDDCRPDEVIEVTSSAPRPPGSISLDAQVARRTAGALGEPFRAVSLLPGVSTSISASGYPIIRGSLPGESRFEFDGIEIPLLYHFLLGSQVIHPSFVGDIELRAGGHGVEQGHLIGGLVSMTPSSTGEARTELRANLAEIGIYRTQPLSRSTSLTVAARTGTLAIAAKIYDSRSAAYNVDQQTRLVHQLDNGDRLTLTSLGAYNYARLPPDAASSGAETDKLGFHRLDGRWTRAREGRQLRAGIETAIDSFRRTGLTSFHPEQGGWSYGVRAYGDGSIKLGPSLTLRGGLHARHRTLVNGAAPFELTASDPFLGLARSIDAQGVWPALDLRLGPLTLTPGVRADHYHAALYGGSARHSTVDPRLAIAADLPGGVRSELAVGVYSAPPQLSVMSANIMVGPLPMADGAGSLAGMNRATEAQLSVRAPMGGDFQGSFAAYYRDTSYAVDFALAGARFQDSPCDNTSPVYRNIDGRVVGVEAMIRRDLGRSVSGWVSYSLSKSDRDLGFIQLPGEFDQRHILNATAQWRHGPWVFSATGHLQTGRPLPYRRIARCSNDTVAVVIKADESRRAPTTLRADVRAERAFQLAGSQLRVYVELQNATFTRETLTYDAVYSGAGPLASPSSYHDVPNTLLIPLPLIGVEAVL